MFLPIYYKSILLVNFNFYEARGLREASCVRGWRDIFAYLFSDWNFVLNLVKLLNVWNFSLFSCKFIEFGIPFSIEMLLFVEFLFSVVAFCLGWCGMHSKLFIHKYRDTGACFFIRKNYCSACLSTRFN